jgi:hypothetical protein
MVHGSWFMVGFWLCLQSLTCVVERDWLMTDVLDNISLLFYSVVSHAYARIFFKMALVLLLSSLMPTSNNVMPLFLLIAK